MENSNPSQNLIGIIDILEKNEYFDYGILYGEDSKFYLFLSRKENNIQAENYIEFILEPIPENYSDFGRYVAMVKLKKDVNELTEKQISNLENYKEDKDINRNKGRVISVNNDDNPMDIVKKLLSLGQDSSIKIQCGRLVVIEDGDPDNPDVGKEFVLINTYNNPQKKLCKEEDVFFKKSFVCVNPEKVDPATQC